MFGCPGTSRRVPLVVPAEGIWPYSLAHRTCILHISETGSPMLVHIEPIAFCIGTIERVGRDGTDASDSRHPHLDRAPCRGAADPAVDALAPREALEHLAQALRDRPESERGSPAGECNSRQFHARHLPWNSPEACSAIFLGVRAPFPPSRRLCKLNSTSLPCGAPQTQLDIAPVWRSGHRFND